MKFDPFQFWYGSPIGFCFVLVFFKEIVNTGAEMQNFPWNTLLYLKWVVGTPGEGMVTLSDLNGSTFD
jgi:hypothetical protein